MNPEHAPPTGPPLAAAAARYEGFALASIVCAVVGLFAAPVLGPVLGIVFGIQAKHRIAADTTLMGSDLAQAGIVIGAASLALTVVVFLFAFVGLAGFFLPFDFNFGY